MHAQHECIPVSQEIWPGDFLENLAPMAIFPRKYGPPFGNMAPLNIIVYFIFRLGNREDSTKIKFLEIFLSIYNSFA
jgi:hypothetical protein